MTFSIEALKTFSLLTFESYSCYLQVLKRPKRLAVSKEEEEEKEMLEEMARDEGFLSRAEVAGDEAFLAQLNCGLSQCTFISCTIGPLAKKQFTLFKVKIINILSLNIM